MQYSPDASVIMVEAISLALLCPYALGPWSGALLELSCSLAVLLPQAASFPQKNNDSQRRSFAALTWLRARRSATSYESRSVTGLPSDDHQHGVYRTPNICVRHSTSQQRHALGHGDHHRAGNLVVP